MPSGISYSHGLKLIDVIDLQGCYTLIIEVDGTLNESGMIMSLEALDNPLVIWLDVCGEIWLEVLNFNTLEVRENDMAREVVLKK